MIGGMSLDTSEFQRLQPAPTNGDFVLDLAGEESAAGFTFGLYAGYEPDSNDIDVSAATITYVGGLTYTIRVTLLKAVMATITVPASTTPLVGGRRNTVPVYLELWRLDSGATYPLGSYILPAYDPVKPPA